MDNLVRDKAEFNPLAKVRVVRLRIRNSHGREHHSANELTR